MPAVCVPLLRVRLRSHHKIGWENACQKLLEDTYCAVAVQQQIMMYSTSGTSEGDFLVSTAPNKLGIHVFFKITIQHSYKKKKEVRLMLLAVHQRTQADDSYEYPAVVSLSS